ncbi:hypothetical protein [Bradyrhizobium sp. dw_411]|uniref:hypothetical protein n=1 Tax=Bradyrhizobium sp. dw_411 TaxID=2720082 RepID=UPI001BD058E7|nr:hypothetical protein [Bradyrhizobium sp. dw_411]
MKMMSWSRYHCLSPSLLRAERRAAKSKSKLRKIWRRNRVPHRRPPVPGATSGLFRYFQFVIRLFRT